MLNIATNSISFMFVIGLMNVNVGFGTNYIIGVIVIGLIIVVLGGILFKKSFLNKVKL